MRTFIGVDFDRELKNAIGELQYKLRKNTIKGRWKHVDNFHLTLKFLDDITESQRDQMAKILKEICTNNDCFKLSISELGVFQGRDSIRVLWLGMNGDLPILKSLQAEIDAGLSKLGFDKEKRAFTPHVTIGQDLTFAYPFEEISKTTDLSQFPPINVQSLHLFKSEQIGNKRIYTKIDEFKLRGR